VLIRIQSAKWQRGVASVPVRYHRHDLDPVASVVRIIIARLWAAVVTIRATLKGLVNKVLAKR